MWKQLQLGIWSCSVLLVFAMTSVSHNAMAGGDLFKSWHGVGDSELSMPVYSGINLGRLGLTENIGGGLGDSLNSGHIGYGDHGQMGHDHPGGDDQNTSDNPLEGIHLGLYQVPGALRTGKEEVKHGLQTGLDAKHQGLQTGQQYLLNGLQTGLDAKHQGLQTGQQYIHDGLRTGRDNLYQVHERLPGFEWNGGGNPFHGGGGSHFQLDPNRFKPDLGSLGQKFHYTPPDVRF